MHMNQKLPELDEAYSIATKVTNQLRVLSKEDAEKVEECLRAVAPSIDSATADFFAVGKFMCCHSALQSAKNNEAL